MRVSRLEAVLTRRAFAAPLIAGVLAALLVACGGGGDAGTPSIVSTPPPVG